MRQKPEISIGSQPPKIALEYVFDAPSRRVFDAWTKAEHVKCWYRPGGAAVCECDIDLRVNGKWRVVLRGADGKEQGLGGEYREVDAPDRLVQTFRYDGAPQAEVVETLTFAERDGKTVLTSTILHKSPEDLDWHVGAGLEAAAADILARLADHLQSPETGAAQPSAAEADAKQKPKAKPISMGRIAAGVAVVLALAGGVLYWSLRDSPSNLEAAAVVKQVPAPRMIDATGVIEAAAATPIRAKASGVVESVSCEMGAAVTVGRVCAKLDPQPLQSAVDRAKAALDAAVAKLTREEAAVAEAQAKLDSDQNSPKRKASARKALEASRAALQRAEGRRTIAESEVERARTALQDAEADLTASEIVSPVEGVVAFRDIEPGRIVSEKDERDLFRIVADPPFVQVHVEPKGKEVDEIAVGDKVSFTVEEIPERVFEGHVGEIDRGAVTEEGATPDRIVVDAPNPDLSLKSGMKAQLKITPARQGEAQGS
jgi:HlyD family secretion protein